MGKQEEKRLCWNCDGYVSFDSQSCPYCASELGLSKLDQTIPEPPYAPSSAEFGVTKEEWANALIPEKKESEESAASDKKELAALLMLIPGISLSLFALMLLFFAKDGVVAFEWKEGFAYFYLLAAAPLLILGFRSIK